MKNIQFLLFIIASAFIVSCDSDDDDFYNTVYVLAENKVTIETQPDYQVGDVLVVTANLARFINEAGHATPLDIRATTGNAPSFVFTYNLERRTGADTWEFVDLTNLFQEGPGSAAVGSFVQAQAEYDPDIETYVFGGGLQLPAAGDYRLSFGYNTAFDRVEMVSNSQGNNITLNIASTIAAINSSGYYTFTVN